MKWKKQLWLFLYIKYGKFGSVSLGHFIKHKTLISEVWACCDHEEAEIIAGLTRSWSKIWVFDRPIKMTRMWLLATGQENDIKLSHELEWSVCLNVLPPPTSSLPTSLLPASSSHESKLSHPPLLPLVNGVMFCAMSSTWWTIKTNKKFYNSLFYGGGFGKFCFWTQIEGELEGCNIFFSPQL